MHEGWVNGTIFDRSESGMVGKALMSIRTANEDYILSITTNFFNYNLKVPKCEIFDLLDSRDFYTIKPS
jgi:hypothetical protein